MAIIKDYEKEYKYIDPTNIDLLKKLINKPPKFFCINDVEKNPKKREILHNKTNDFLEKLYITKPFFEN